MYCLSLFISSFTNRIILYIIVLSCFVHYSFLFLFSLSLSWPPLRFFILLIYVPDPVGSLSTCSGGRSGGLKASG